MISTNVALPGPRKVQARWRGSPLVLKIAAGVLLLLVWQAVVEAFAPSYVARPTGIVRVLGTVITDDGFLAAAVATLRAVIGGLLVSIVIGTALGLLMGRVRLAEHGLRYYVDALNATPMVAILPLLTLWFGYSGDTRFAVVVFAAVFSIAINACDGARTVPLEYLEVARAFRARALPTLFEVVLPASLPYLIAGVRLAAGRALIGAVVAEFFVSIPGLGYYILYNSRSFRHNEAFVAVLVLVAAGLAFDGLTRAATTRFLPWHRTS